MGKREVTKVDDGEITTVEKVIGSPDVDRDDLTKADKEVNLVVGTLGALEALREQLRIQSRPSKQRRRRAQGVLTIDPTQARLTTGNFDGTLEEALMSCATLCSREGVESTALTSTCASHAAGAEAITAVDATLRQLIAKLSVPPLPTPPAPAKPAEVDSTGPAGEDVGGADEVPQSADGYATDAAEGEWSECAFTIKQLAQACPRGTRAEVASIVMYIPKSDMLRPPGKPKGRVRVRFTNLERGVADKLREIEKAIIVSTEERLKKRQSKFTNP